MTRTRCGPARERPAGARGDDHHALTEAAGHINGLQRVRHPVLGRALGHAVWDGTPMTTKSRRKEVCTEGCSHILRDRGDLDAVGAKAMNVDEGDLCSCPLCRVGPDDLLLGVGAKVRDLRFTRGQPPLERSQLGYLRLLNALEVNAWAGSACHGNHANPCEPYKASCHSSKPAHSPPSRPCSITVESSPSRSPCRSYHGPSVSHPLDQTPRSHSALWD